MAKPCRYQLPGTDTWMSESEFKKALNDGLIDKFMTENNIAVRGLKPKAVTASASTETTVETPATTVAETKVEPVQEAKPKSLLDESTEIIDSLKDGESFTFPDGSIATKNGNSFDYQSSEKGKGKQKFSSRERMILFTNNKLSESRVGKNIELKNYETETVTGDKLKVGDVYVRDILGTRYVFKLLSKPTRDSRGNFHTVKVEVLSIGNQPVGFRSSTPSSELGEVSKNEKVVGGITYDSFKSATKDSTTFGNVKKINNWESTTTKTESTKETPVEPVVETKAPEVKQESQEELPQRVKNLKQEFIESYYSIPAKNKKKRRDRFQLISMKQSSLDREEGIAAELATDEIYQLNKTEGQTTQEAKPKTEPVAKEETPKAESNTEKITRGADMLKNMSEEERDNFIDDWFNDRIPRESLPGGSDAIKLYEARIVAPKPMNKPKRLTMDNAFELSNEHGFIINIDGELYGLSKVEDPDSTSEAEDKFGDPKEYVWVYSKISEGIDGKTTETYTSDINEVIDDIKSSKSTKAETKVEPTQAKEPEAEYQKEEPAKQPSKARYQGKSKFGADQEYAVTLDKDGNPTEVKAIINGSEAKSLQIAKIREDKNGKTIITTTDDIISLDKPSVQKETISFEAQKSMNNDMLSKARESNGDYAIIYTRAGDQIPLKLNRVTGKWMAVNGEGKLVEASEAYQQKAKEAVNWTRKDAKIVDLKTSSNGVPTTTRMVFDFSDNTWKKLNEDEQILYSVPKGMQEKAQSKFVEENPKRAAKREKVEKFFNDRKVDENIIMSTIPGLNPKNINRIIDAAKALVLAGMDLTTAINQAANNVLKQLVREKEITQQEADEALIEVYKGDFLLRPELSGIKNELASENAQEVARKGIDKMGVKEALDAGARAIQDGEVNPESLIETFVQGVGRVLTPIETAAMIRYKAGLDNEISDQYVKLASIEDKNSNEAKQVKTEIERLEKKVENYEIMQVTTGYYQSLSFSLRQFMLTSEYNITKLKAEIAAGYDGKIPEDILAKINEANAKLTQLNKDIARLEREKAKLEDSETIESIKNEKTKSSSGKAITSSNGRISISTDKIKEAISKGADTIEDVIEYVREDVKKQYPDATDREIRDAITNYGKVSSNTKSDLQKKIEEIRSIGKKISALEDIQAEKKRRESSKVTGFFAKQRAKNRLRILSDREQELKRQIKEEMSKMPLTEEEIALKEDKRLEAFKKRTEARIKELKQRIADGDFSTKPRPKSLELDEEAKKLNAEREKILFQFEEEKAKAKYRQRSDAQVAFDALMSILTLSKSLIASLDFSAPFRQGFVYTMSQDPRKTKKQMQEMFKLMNEENYTNWLADLKASDEYNLIKASKLFVAEPSAELSAREESFMSNLGQYIPVLGKSIKTKSEKEVRVGFDLYGKSERAYSGFLNVLRVQAFMEGATTLKEQGYTMEKNPEVFKAMADFVNNSTGRGTGGRAFENSAAALSAVFFSPRLIKSRLNLFNPVYYYKMPPSVRAIALKRMSKLMATSTMMIALLAIAAAGSGGDDEDDLKIELDPRSSDFAKIRMKDTRIDILGGFQPYFRTFVQAITGEKKDIETGEIKKLNADFGGATKMSVISNLFTNKFSPISRTFYEYLSKYDYQKEADAAKEGKYSAYTDLAVPIYLQGIGDLYDEQGLNILWLTPLSVFGFDVQKYDKNPGKSNPYQNDFEFESFEEFDDFDSEFETSDPFKN